MTRSIYLASSSKYRRELLTRLQLNFRPDITDDKIIRDRDRDQGVLHIVGAEHRQRQQFEQRRVGVRFANGAAPASSSYAMHPSA